MNQFGCGFFDATQTTKLSDVRQGSPDRVKETQPRIAFNRDSRQPLLCRGILVVVVVVAVVVF